MDSFSNIQERGVQQLSGLSEIPGSVLQNWPVFFSFSLVHYVEDMVISAIPNLGGGAGLVLNAAIRGAREVINFVTWDKLRMF